MLIYQQNLHYAQKLQKQAYDKDVKPCNYVLDKKAQLNSKFIKTNKNCKLEIKFLRTFQVFYFIDKQVYKLEILAQ